MRKQLMAAVLIPLGLGLAGVTQAQSSTPAFQNNSSEAQRKAGNNQATAELFYMIQQLQREVRDVLHRVGGEAAAPHDREAVGGGLADGGLDAQFLRHLDFVGDSRRQPVLEA